MTLGRLIVSAMGLMTVASAHPHAHQQFHYNQNAPASTITLTTVSTLTQHVAVATNSAVNKGSGTNKNPVATTSNGTLPGICYAPYCGDHNCKTQAQINDDFSRIKGSYGLVRIYGTDCDQVAPVYHAAKSIGVQLFLGIWDVDQVQQEAQMIIDGINGDWDIVHTVSVGNELVNNGQATPQKVINAVNQARTILRAGGYNGPVVTVDTFVAAEAHPELCEASDYCAVNAHAFFDSTVAAPQAGQWLLNTVSSLKSKTSKPIVVTESGWPTAGMTNGLAVPGLSQQQAAISSLREAFSDNPGDLILFSAYNDPWKPREAATFYAEQHWGINGEDSASG